MTSSRAGSPSPRRSGWRARARLRVALAAGAAFLLILTQARCQEAHTMSEKDESVAAPEFPGGLEWFNTAAPLRLADLRGKFVVLDFWTYCCINCMHILPDLKRLERKYENELVVIGVHSAKFEGERLGENIRQAILRYEIEHPVVNDAEMRVWQRFGVRAWPSVFLISPRGDLLGAMSGEGVFEPLDAAISQAIPRYEADGSLVRGPFRPALERERAPRSFLAFPGKVLAEAGADRLFIADSGNHRVAVAALSTGEVLHVIGGPEPGLEDGDFETARFRNPQGLAWDAQAGALYVADTDNHALRRVDFARRRVETLSGLGRQGGYPPLGGPARKTELNSPWDLVFAGGRLYIAMAGNHQLWVYDPAREWIEPYAGSGRENLADGSLERAALAQPSGITTDGRRLYFADSEVSAIRWADLPPGGRVGTLVGTGLFDFGDRDGAGDRARLQHPLGVVFAGGVLYVADTYNNKIKRLDPGTRECVSLFGANTGGYRDGPGALFDEPGGLSHAAGKLYIADTNNHLIRVADLATSAVETFRFRNPEALIVKSGEFAPDAPRIPLEPQRVSTSASTLTLTLSLPGRHHLNPLAPSRVELRITGGEGGAFLDGSQVARLPLESLTLKVPVSFRPGEFTIEARARVFYCAEGREARCLMRDMAAAAPLRVDRSETTRKILLPLEIRE